MRDFPDDLDYCARGLDGTVAYILVCFSAFSVEEETLLKATLNIFEWTQRSIAQK